MERETVETLERLKGEFIKSREEFWGSIPSAYMQLLKWAIENCPKEKQEEFFRKVRISLTTWREETQRAHIETIDRITESLKLQFNYSIAYKEETEKRLLAFVDLLKEILHHFLEEAKVIIAIEKEVITMQFPEEQTVPSQS